MAKFYLICGISGGGKSILTARILTKNPGLKIFDPDDYYRKVNGDECIHENFFPVWMNMWQDIHDCEIRGEDVLINSNALTVAQRNQFIEWFPTFEHHMIWVISPKEKCIEGNEKRRRHVPLDKLMSQWERMEFPNAHELGWDSITHLTNFWTDDYIIFKLKGDIEKIIKL